ncbi:hypothetical protein [Hyphomicrobium sulfonivorans]|uniref:hypothetical protein n=1 Tax=Hyphomicrobium sulfonivorans TaxID=121290 RepID=UPI00156E3A82|nr:hypothetical protein [Hyphomicrobium sulfonivorans]MBI1649866.1 hypothetical protein [Hyphomicrobium sulfonivorans]NSL71776.1 hypothetical protein [Hyphomicrobium sulfonivorans]
MVKPPKKSAEQRAGSIKAEVAAALIRVTLRRLQQLVAEGWIKKEAGHYTIRGVVHGYLNFLDSVRERATKNEADNRVRAARAREIELRTAREESELIPTDEAVAYTQAVVGALISRMNGLPAQITRDLNERRRIEAMLDKIRSEVAAVSAEHGAAYRSLPDIDRADAEDHAKRLGGE